MFSIFAAEKKSEKPSPESKQELTKPLPAEKGAIDGSVRPVAPVIAAVTPIKAVDSTVLPHDGTPTIASVDNQEVIEGEDHEHDHSKEDLPRNLLMISNKRPRAFYERAARELLASGNDTVQLSALGDAIPLAIQLAMTLQDKNAVILGKIETKAVEFLRRGSEKPVATDKIDVKRYEKYVSRAPGISILLNRHPKFKGTRIVPGYVFFCSDNLPIERQAYPLTPDRVFASVNSGGRDTTFDTTATGAAFTAALGSENSSAYATLHDYLLKEARIPNKNETDVHSIKFVGELSGVKNYNSDLKAAFCRVCPKLKDVPKLGATGTVFIDAFDEGKYPHGNDNNACLIHVVSPRGGDFRTSEDFLSAVSLTATNLMTALCDFNGYVKRQIGDPKLRRLGVVRLGVFSGDELNDHPNLTELNVAQAILKGLNAGYHFGPAPRLQFCHPAFKTVWLEETGLDVSALQITDSTFRKSYDLSHDDIEQQHDS